MQYDKFTFGARFFTIAPAPQYINLNKFKGNGQPQ